MKTIVVIASVVLALTSGSAFAKKAGTAHAGGGHSSSVAHAGSATGHAAKGHAKKGGKHAVAASHAGKSHLTKGKAKPKSKQHGGKKASGSSGNKHAASLR